MEDNLAIVILVAIIVPVLGWLALTANYHNKKLAVMASDQDVMNDKLNTLVNSFDKMNNKLDMFLRSELDALKKLSEASTSAMEKIANKK